MRLIDAEELKISIAKKIQVDSYEKDEVINGVLQIIDEQPTVPAFGQCNKLPFDEFVLVTDGKHVWKDCFCVVDNDVYLDSGAEIANAIAWMPLPEPPKGGNDR